MRWENIMRKYISVGVFFLVTGCDLGPDCAALADMHVTVRGTIGIIHSPKSDGSRWYIDPTAPLKPAKECTIYSLALTQLDPQCSPGKSFVADGVVIDGPFGPDTLGVGHIRCY
jgi:hypothetical protein